MADEDVVRLKIGDETLTLDMSDLTLGEIGEIEDLCRRSVADIDFTSARGMQGLVWAAKHRDDPTFTIQDAGDIRLTAITDETGEIADDREQVPPTGGSRPRAKSGGSSSKAASTSGN